MLAVLGSPTYLPGAAFAAGDEAGGLAAGIARAAAGSGAHVQLIGKVGDDPAGDAVLIALARAGVGHLAILRDAGRATPVAPLAARIVDPADATPFAALLAAEDVGDPEPGEGSQVAPALVDGLALEPADILLGLRYVSDFRVLVAADPLDEACAAVVAEEATFANATLVAVARDGHPIPAALGAAIVLEAPPADPDGAFADLVGRFAAAVDRGDAAAEAFRAATAEGGWERTAD